MTIFALAVVCKVAGGYLAFWNPQAVAPTKPAPPKAIVLLDVAPQTPDRLPVVVKLTNATATTQIDWTITPTPKWQEPLADAVGFRFTGPPKKYHLRAVYCDFDAKFFGWKEVDVEIVGDVPPAPIDPPTPIDPPKPPPDVDEAAKIKAAYSADEPIDPAKRKAAALRVVAYCVDVAAAAKKSEAKSVGEFFAGIRAECDEAALKKDLPKTRDVIAAKVYGLFGAKEVPPANAITADQRKAFAAIFETYAAFLEAAIK